MIYLAATLSLIVLIRFDSVVGLSLIVACCLTQAMIRSRRKP